MRPGRKLPTQTSAEGNTQAFDLNIAKVLEHWSVAFAIREVIANALDEQTLTGSAAPQITKVGEGRWDIQDFGRGLRYQHLTQNESAEKRRHAEVIGQFGMGLKDALAVFDRRSVGVCIRTGHGDITTGQKAKAGFGDVVTLHALVTDPSEPSMTGTLVQLIGIKDADIEAAKGFFLAFSGDTQLEQTRYGSVLARRQGSKIGRVYVRGLLVAEEPNFLFSYNITDLTGPLRKALNRERSNVGRTAYSPRVKDMLKTCRSAAVANPLAADLAGLSRGNGHDELQWQDVTLHACAVLQTLEKVLFITALELEKGSPQIQYAKDDGYRLVVVPENIVRALQKHTDLEGEPLVDLERYRQSWNDSFSFMFIDPTALSVAEQKVFALVGPVTELAGLSLKRVGVDAILISETMRLADDGSQVMLGVFEDVERRIVIRRDQLTHAAAFCGTLLHELAHARSGVDDGTFEFEDELTRLLGKISAATANR